MKTKSATTLATLITTALLTATITPHAHAHEGWYKAVSCGINWTANMQTTSSKGFRVIHRYPGTSPQIKDKGGYYATSERNMSGLTTLTAATHGKFTSHSAGCYCPPGRNCGR